METTYHTADRSETPTRDTTANPFRTGNDDGASSVSSVSGRVQMVLTDPHEEDVLIDPASHQEIPFWVSEDGMQPTAISDNVLTTVQITNLPPVFNAYTTEQFLAQHGFRLRRDQLVMIHVPCNRRKAQARGFFFVDCATISLAQRIVQELHGLHPAGFKRPLKVAITKNQRGRQSFKDVTFPPGFEPLFA